MYLRTGINLEKFLDCISKCQGEVFLHTQEKDCINLKSQLSKYVFLFMCDHQNSLSDNKIVCEFENDYIVLKDYLQQG